MADHVKFTGIIESVVKVICLSAVFGIGPIGTAAAQSNPIVIENQQPGTSDWRIPWGSSATDIGGEIKGFASATSVNKGQNITFYVSTNPAQSYTIDVYRMGWYQGLGGRLMQHIGPLNGIKQPSCPTDSTTGLTECHWTEEAYTLATQASWTSGIYLALLTNAQMYQNYIIFVVRDDNRVAALLYKQPITTYGAYNNYPNDNSTGKSLYDYNSFGATTVTGTPRAAKVSFDRPYPEDGTRDFLSWEVNFVRWVEKSGYDVAYATDVDIHTNGQYLLRYKGLLSVGHDEYWSKPIYDAVVAARDAGVNVAFFGANAVGAQVRFEPSSGGVPNRVIVCYRDATLDPVTDPSLKTVGWRSALLNRPEQMLIGVQYSSIVPWNGTFPPYVVTNSGNWVYAGTGFSNGDSVPGIVGYESDRLFSQYPPPNAVNGTYTLLSVSTYTNDYANSSIYQAPSGAWVFGAGTIGWSWALDDYNSAYVDARIQRTTANILDRFVGTVLTSDFTLSASSSTQTVTPGGSTSYSVALNPVGGFTGQVNLSVSGLPTGANGSFSPNPTTTSSTLSVTTSTSTPLGSYTLTITGVSGTLTHTTTVSVTVAAAQTTVAYDNAVSSGFQFGVTTITTPAFTVGSGTNRAAMIMVGMSANNATNITARLDSVNGTVIPGTDSGTTATIRTLIFQVINPPSGSQTATVSWTGAMNADVGVITVSGADQSTPCTNGTFTATNSTPDATTSVTISSNSGDLTASIGYTTDGWATPATNQTAKWGPDSGAVGGDIGAGTGTTTHTWTDVWSFETHSVSGANFKVGAF